MDRAGVPQRVGMMISGHKTPSIYHRYNIVSDADLRLAATRRAEYEQTQKIVNGHKIGTIADFQNKADKSQTDN
jgi:hypothetical protein